MAWPCRRELWGELLDQAKADHATVAHAVARFEPVLMVARPGDGAEAEAALDGDIEVLELPIDDSWLRDSGPVILLGSEGRRAGADFRFNAWGEKFSPWGDDDALAGRLLGHLGIERHAAPFVLEGGSICSDGQGTLITTEQCLLHPSRNPGMDREEIEQGLCDFLGVERVVWLGRGLVEDRDTDGHVDLIAAFAPSGAVVLQTVPDDNPNAASCAENARRLRAADLEVVGVRGLPYAEVAGEQVPVAPLNFYIADGALIVPVTDGVPAPPELAAAYPDHEIVGVPGAVLAHGGGGPHCITQQVPAPAL